MARTNGDADMSYSARNAGPELLWGECICFPHERALCHRGGGGLDREKFFVDSDCPGLCRLIGTFGASPPWVMVFGRGQTGVAFRRVAFSSRREALAIRNEANCCR